MQIRTLPSIFSWCLSSGACLQVIDSRTLWRHQQRFCNHKVLQPAYLLSQTTTPEDDNDLTEWPMVNCSRSHLLELKVNKSLPGVLAEGWIRWLFHRWSPASSSQLSLGLGGKHVPPITKNLLREVVESGNGMKVKVVKRCSKSEMDLFWCILG